jgi:hypothetical protein
MNPYLRLCSTLFFACTPLWASSPLAGHFHLSGGQQIVGGPTYVVFEVVNNGAQALRIQTANALSPCAGYLFQIDGEKRADGTCDGLPGYSCVSGTIELAPGAKSTQKVLLNYYYKLPRAGLYHIHARRSVSWWPADQGLFGELREQQVFEDDIELNLKPTSPVELRAVFSPYVTALASTNTQEHKEALEAIVYLAPPFMEETLLKMIDSDEWGEALIGLQHLNTVGAKEALSKIAENGVQIKPDADDLEKAERSVEPGLAIKYLGEMGDPAYFPLLLEVTKRASFESQTRFYGTLAVGKLGGQDAIPFLVSEINASTEGQRMQGAIAMSLTASRDAMPPLLNLLKSPEEDVRQVAENGLETLTHRRVMNGNVSTVDPALLYRTWQSWWKWNSGTARIYAHDECGEKLPID